VKTWGVVLVAAVLTAMAFLPALPEVREAKVVSQTTAEPLQVLRLESVTPVELPSRSPVQAFVTAQKPLDGMRIVIDPGHGGQTRWKGIKYTGGTEGVATGQTESDVNLRVSLLLRQYLQAAGAEVIMTRVSDDRITDGGKEEELDVRANIANSRNADLFISVHHNQAPRPDANYTVVFYPAGMPKAIGLAENIASSVSYHLRTNNVGGKPGSYRVLRGIRMPGVIVEASFMSNPAEDLRLQSLAYNKLEAKAIATGILNYVRIEKGRQVDFNTIFAPIDSQASRAQAIADATFVRKQIVEKRSLFGVRYEEVTYDAAGRVVSSREICAGTKTVKKPAQSAATRARSGIKVALASPKSSVEAPAVAGSGKSAAAKTSASKAKVSATTSSSKTKTAVSSKAVTPRSKTVSASSSSKAKSPGVAKSSSKTSSKKKS
jgi:N-acetylmuramoyl-L-alanine amidase